MTYLRAAEVAEFTGLSVRHIRRLITSGKIDAIEKESAANNRKELLIPLTSLDEKVQQRYLKKLHKDLGLPAEKPREAKPAVKAPAIKKPLDQYTADERSEIALWTGIIKEWLARRDAESSKCEFDKLFVANMKYQNRELVISTDILYSKYRAYLNNDINGFIDKRGGWNKGNSSIPEHIFQAFLSCYFYSKLKIPECYKIAIQWAKEHCPQDVDRIPTMKTFRNQLKKIPESVVARMREGEKYYYDKYSPYITRIYDDLEANDVWFADNHTFDIITLSEDGTEHRLYLTAFTDAKSGVMVGFNITDNPSSDSTLLALRDGILKFGLPKCVYVDNGSEFLTHDFGGKGHRKKESWNKDDHPPTILDGLEIEMINALPRNARAKNIERAFNTLCEHISKAFTSYCGGNILKRPESLKAKLKRGEITTDQELKEVIGTLINGGYNMEAYGGSEQHYKGKTRIEVWNDSIKYVEFRKAAKDDLALLLARTSRYQKVGRNGVYIKFKKETIWYINDDIFNYQGQLVYVRFDPADIREVRVYNIKDEFMFTCRVADELLQHFLAKRPEDAADGNKLIRHVGKQVKEYGKGLTSYINGDNSINILDSKIVQAKENLKNFEINQPTKYVSVMSDQLLRENPQLGNIERIEWDLTKLNNNALINAQKRKG